MSDLFRIALIWGLGLLFVIMLGCIGCYAPVTVDVTPNTDVNVIATKKAAMGPAKRCTKCEPCFCKECVCK